MKCHRESSRRDHPVDTVFDIKKALAYRDARAMQAESRLLINVLLRRSAYFALP